MEGRVEKSGIHPVWEVRPKNGIFLLEVRGVRTPKMALKTSFDVGYEAQDHFLYSY